MKKKNSYIKITVSGESEEDTRILAIHISSILNVAGMSVTCPYSTTGPHAAAVKFAQLVCNNDMGILVKQEIITPEIKEKPIVDIDSPLYKTILTIINDILRIDTGDIKPESEFIKDLGADSLDTVELVMSAEEEFGIIMDEDESEKLITVADAYFYLKEHTCR